MTNYDSKTDKNAEHLKKSRYQTLKIFFVFRITDTDTDSWITALLYNYSKSHNNLQLL